MPTIRELRLISGLTQHETARRSVVDRSRLSLVEAGYAVLRPAEEAAVRRVLRDEIERRATALTRFLETDGAVTSAKV
jgi:transcriptional regulator with XRE-family HTH domain